MMLQMQSDVIAWLQKYCVVWC